MSDPAAPVAPSPASHPAFFAAVKATLLHCLYLLTGKGKVLFSVLLPVLETAAGTALETLAPIAEEIVLSLATSGQAGDEKRKIAFTQIQTAAIQAGVSAANSVINASIELAFQNLQATGKINEAPQPVPAVASPAA